jgi:DeoR/GlpR family transcriptional regulator of sugar metabolism
VLCCSGGAGDSWLDRKEGFEILAVDRRHHILERVADQQTIQVNALARELSVSEMTIRRDIHRLERDGFLRRTYGGATAHLTRAVELAINARALQHAAAKRRIGMAAARLVEGASTLFVGVGTTAEQFARFLTASPRLLVVTGSLPVASLLGTRSIRSVVLGGIVQREELGCSGPIALASVARYHADVAVIGAAGISARGGITELEEDVAETNRLMMERSDSVVVLADGSKVGSVTRATVAPVASGQTLITDEVARTAELDQLREAGMRVLITSSEGA